MEFNELIPEYRGDNLAGWRCARCDWKFEKDEHVADIDAWRWLAQHS